MCTAEACCATPLLRDEDVLRDATIGEVSPAVFSESARSARRLYKATVQRNRECSSVRLEQSLVGVSVGMEQESIVSQREF
jgi:hypothetical protein